jgi:raffinose/stachyose/melibiose transport system permease protein
MTGIGMKRSAIRQGWWIAFFVFPALVIVLVFILIPLFVSLFNSLFDWHHLIRGDFAGGGNFKKIFTLFPFKDRFFNALGNNAKWFFSTMLVQNSIALFFGYMLARRIPGENFFKRVFFIPVLFSIVAVGFLWGLYLKPDGLVNGFLKLTGRGNLARAWLGDEKTATFTLIAVNIWRWLGFPSLVFLAAVDAVPAEYIEASYLDGAGERRIFRSVIFPLILPSVTIIAVLTTIGSLNVFEQIYTMASLDGSPNYSTDTIGTLFYRTAFGSSDSGTPMIGLGSAIGVLIYFFTFLLSLCSIAATRSREVDL